MSSVQDDGPRIGTGILKHYHQKVECLQKVSANLSKWQVLVDKEVVSVSMPSERAC